ncbi:MAG: hypothetical protein QME79_14465 [Bacillota bacterium]|nr:hypothetical protein [Bacillota bacterium]
MDFTSSDLVGNARPRDYSPARRRGEEPGRAAREKESSPAG